MQRADRTADVDVNLSGKLQWKRHGEEQKATVRIAIVMCDGNNSHSKSQRDAMLLYFILSSPLLLL